MYRKNRTGYYTNELKAIEFIKKSGQQLTFERVDNVAYVYDNTGKVIKKFR